MGLIIEELHDRQPDLVYFDADYKGEYPKESPLTISEMEEIYPIASERSKKDVLSPITAERRCPTCKGFATFAPP